MKAPQIGRVDAAFTHLHGRFLYVIGLSRYAFAPPY